MCDETFDRERAQVEAFAPVVRAALRSGPAWDEVALREELASRFPGLCWDPEAPAEGPARAAPTWREVVLQVVAWERALAPSEERARSVGRGGHAPVIDLPVASLP